MVRAAHIILASASPRRVSILNEQMGFMARVVPSTFAEDLDKSLFTPTEYVRENARQKALEVFSRCEIPFSKKHDGRPPSLVIGADTVVVLGDQVLEKPSSTEDARKMLRTLSGGSHCVQTGVALAYGGSEAGKPHVHTFVEETTVTFSSLSEAEIEAYVNTGEPMDKAGSYGIQGLGGAFVTGIVGDYQNVVGFPLSRFCRELDTDRLRTWIDGAPPEEVSPIPASVAESDTIEPTPGNECEDEECGLPSD